MYDAKTDEWKVLALNNENTRGVHVALRLVHAISLNEEKHIDRNPGKKEQGENNMSLQITCLSLKYDVLITT